ncbi:GlxA family transcriptional regulator [Flavitalea antarctica]
MNAQNIKKILFIVPPKVHLLDITGPAHIYYEAKEYNAEIELHFICFDEVAEVESSAGLFFSRLTCFDQFELSATDFVFVPGLDYSQILDNHFHLKFSPFLNWLKRQYAGGTKICSVCTGAFILAEAGLFNGKNCTTHWKYFSRFSLKYPQANLKRDRLFVVEDHIYSSAGVSSGIDLALYILEEQFGTKLAIDVAKEVVVYLRRGESDPQLSIFLQYRNHLDTRIHDAQDFMLRNISHNCTLEVTANHVNMSMRNLTRNFKKTTGITVGYYLEKLRVERAVQLLADGNKMLSVSLDCGFKSPNQLRALLKKHLQVLPVELSDIS